MDPVTNLDPTGTAAEVTGMLTRLIDFLKRQGITAVFTSLTEADNGEARTSACISSLMDTWLLLRQAETNGNGKRSLAILKSRGMAHSSEVSSFLLADNGIKLEEVVRQGA
jgi:circadian clock protein KaiC